MSATTERTTVSLPNDVKDSLDDAAESIFGTKDVPYRTTIEQLIENCESVQ